ncbi:hypothetical protein MHYP_G00120960 [Metynnis hypsauchen]
MEMFKLLGVQKVAIYKTSCYPDTQKVLDYYVREGFVDIIPWTLSSYIDVARGWKKSTLPGDLEFFGQIVALNDCVYCYINRRPENTPDLWKQVEGENILPHVYRIPNDPNVFNNFKVIVNPRLVFKATAHGLLDSMGGTVRLDPKIAHMYHIKIYPSKYFSPKSIIRGTRLWDYADKLIPAVSEVLGQALNRGVYLDDEWFLRQISTC